MLVASKRVIRFGVVARISDNQGQPHASQGVGDEGSKLINVGSWASTGQYARMKWSPVSQTTPNFAKR